MIFSQNKTLIFSLVILYLYIIHFFILGENTYIRIHDELDSTIVWFKILAESGKIFAGNYEKIPAFMNAPRVSLGNEFNVVVWLYYIFDPYWAYVLNQVIIRGIAYIGMYLLLDRYILDGKLRNYNFLISLLYTILPFWSSAGITVAGLPIVTYAFLNIRNLVSTKYDWFILVVYQFYSVFILSGMFIIVMVAIVLIFDIYNKKNSKKLITALLLFGIVGVLINYRLIESFFLDTSFVSHRVEQVAKYRNFFDSLRASINHFLHGQGHTDSHHILILPFIFVIFIFNILTENKNKLIIILFLLNIVISLVYGFWEYEKLRILKESYPFLIPLNLGRIYYISPFVWYVLFALSIKYYVRYYKNIDEQIKNSLHLNKSQWYKALQNINVKFRIYFLITLQIFYLFYWSDFFQGLVRSNLYYPTYKQFYSKELFHEIRRYIGVPTTEYKVVGLGVYPSILQYNGFYTLDGYSSNYSLKYKHEFRKIIEKELDKNNKIKKYFDEWGNRCYLFTNEGGLTSYNGRSKNINIDLNVTKLYEMGGRYILSLHKVKDPIKNSLKLLKLFNINGVFYKIYLYKINKN